jgi:hypothetical protein
VEHDEEEITSLTGEREENESEQERSLISLLATFGVLAVTILATLSATVAAISAYQEDIANRYRQLWGSYSLALTIQEDNTSNSTKESNTAQTLDFWRAVFDQSLAAQSGSPQARAELQLEAMGDANAANTAPGQQPAESLDAGPSNRSLCGSFADNESGIGQVGSQSDCAAEFAAAYGQTAESFLRNERTYLAIASALAIALFLFALSRTLFIVPMQVLFLVTAAVIALGGAGIGLYEYVWRSADQPNAAAITAYENGYFKQAVTMSPDFADAWVQRGLYDFDYGRCPQTVQDLRRGAQLDPNPINQNFLASGEMSCGQVTAASDVITKAFHDPNIVDIQWPLSSAAEFFTLLGDTKDADQALSLGIDGMRNVTSSDAKGRGWLYQDLWFSNMLEDQGWITGMAPRQGKAFIRQVEADEAELDASTSLGRGLPTRHLSGVKISHLSDQATQVCCFGTAKSSNKGPAGSVLLRPSGLALPKDVTLPTPVQVSFHYTGLKSGDVVTLIWYDNSDDSSGHVAQTYEVVGQPQAPPPGAGTYMTPGWIFAPNGSYQLTAVVNSTFESQTTVNVPSPTVAAPTG